MAEKRTDHHINERDSIAETRTWSVNSTPGPTTFNLGAVKVHRQKQLSTSYAIISEFDVLREMLRRDGIPTSELRVRPHAATVQFLHGDINYQGAHAAYSDHLVDGIAKYLAYGSHKPPDEAVLKRDLLQTDLAKQIDKDIHAYTDVVHWTANNFDSRLEDHTNDQGLKHALAQCCEIALHTNKSSDEIFWDIYMPWDQRILTRTLHAFEHNMAEVKRGAGVVDLRGMPYGSNLDLRPGLLDQLGHLMEPSFTFTFDKKERPKRRQRPNMKTSFNNPYDEVWENLLAIQRVGEIYVATPRPTVEDIRLARASIDVMRTAEISRRHREPIRGAPGRLREPLGVRFPELKGNRAF